MGIGRPLKVEKAGGTGVEGNHDRNQDALTRGQYPAGRVEGNVARDAGEGFPWEVALIAHPGYYSC